ncbi:MAG: hypothetical protein QNJ73_04300 [Gammaproteobacteria bacterium]|nr:hypothetical protein [Gammaproteobacteria bacterium]
MNDLLAPTEYVAALWAVAFLIGVGIWCLWSSRRLRKLVDRIRSEDPALWQELGSPERWDDVANVRNWSTLRRVRIDQVFAQQFNQQVIEDLRGLQQTITIGLVVMAAAGLFVMYLVWPYR